MHRRDSDPAPTATMHVTAIPNSPTPAGTRVNSPAPTQSIPGGLPAARWVQLTTRRPRSPIQTGFQYDCPKVHLDQGAFNGAGLPAGDAVAGTAPGGRDARDQARMPNNTLVVSSPKINSKSTNRRGLGGGRSMRV